MGEQMIAENSCPENGLIKKEIPTETVIFMLDALIDRFLQAYAQTYLDTGLKLASRKTKALDKTIDSMIQVLRQGMAPEKSGG